MQEEALMWGMVRGGLYSATAYLLHNTCQPREIGSSLGVEIGAAIALAQCIASIPSAEAPSIEVPVGESLGFALAEFALLQSIGNPAELGYVPFSMARGFAATDLGATILMHTYQWWDQWCENAALSEHASSVESAFESFRPFD